VGPDGLGGLRCGGCGAVVAPPCTVCPRCGRVNPERSRECVDCSAALTVECPGCRRICWAGADRCAECGRELDPLGHAFRPIGRSDELRRAEHLQRLPGLRDRAERESRDRLEMLAAADRRRAVRNAERAAQAELRQRRIVRGVGIAVLVFLALVLAAALVFR
jgi:hypothetical protein